MGKPMSRTHPGEDQLPSLIHVHPTTIRDWFKVLELPMEVIYSF